MFIPIELFLIGLVLQKNCAQNLDLRSFQQHDYKLQFVRSEVVRYNKDIMSDYSAVTFKYNRTIAVVNMTFTFKIDVSNDFEVIIQAYKFMSNEYRFFPMRFAVNVCKAIAADVFGIKNTFAKCGNLASCPLRKGIIYYGCNLYPNPAKFPPLIPNGEYKLEVQMLHSSQEAAVTNIYIVISRPMKQL